MEKFEKRILNTIIGKIKCNQLATDNVGYMQWPDKYNHKGLHFV
ncbi:MAG: hypothetical protein BWZ00_00313 [Bacteroidetes bacterium ADurb.BinA174]|nr:MAG: hypothetical protein BWZ00_00313 [Bacteroidetes bacterium ADurb.BinA174]